MPTETAIGLAGGCAAVTKADVVTALSRPMFRALGAPSWSVTPAQGRALRALSRDDPRVPLWQIFDMAFAISASKFRTEYYYKNVLVNRLVFGRHSPRTAAALVELGSRSSIADLVVLNGTSTAYEIKTDFDDFARLPLQLADYRECFERSYVVVSDFRVDAAFRNVPEHVGLITVDRRGHLSERRQARGGLERLRPHSMFGVLRSSEVLAVLERTLDYTPDVPGSQLWARTRDLFGTLPIDVAHSEMTRELRARGQRSAHLAVQVPRSLRARAYDVAMSRTASERITRRLQEAPLSLLL